MGNFAVHSKLYETRRNGNVAYFIKYLMQKQIHSQKVIYNKTILFFPFKCIGIAWYLCVDMQLYIIAPALVYLIRQFKKNYSHRFTDFNFVQHWLLDSFLSTR